MRVRTSTGSLRVLAMTALLVAHGGQMGLAQPAGLSDNRIAAGLKEALRIGTQNAVNLTERPDGFFRNSAIKILLPAQLQPLEKGLRTLGYGPQLDELILLIRP